MSSNLIYDVAQEALYLLLLLSAPILFAGLLTSVLAGLLMHYIKLSEPAIGAMARMLAILGGLILISPWIGHRLVAFTQKTWLLFHTLVS